MNEIDVKVPFRLMEHCSSKHEWDPSTDEYYKHNHYKDCMCHGSNMQPTGIGYEVLNLIKWAFEFAAWRLTPVRDNPTTIQTAINRASESEIKRYDWWARKTGRIK